MANTFASALVPRILPATLEVLRESCPLLTDASKDYAASAANLGDTVTIQTPVALSSGDVTPAMISPSPSNVAPGYKQISIDSWKKATFGLTQKEYTEIIAGNTVPYQVMEAVRTVANTVSASIWAKYYQISNVAGTAGTGVFASNSATGVAAACYALDKARCPRGNRQLYVSLRDGNDLRTNTVYSQFYYVGEAGPDNIVRNGNIGKAFFDFNRVNMDYDTVLHDAGTDGGSTMTTSGATLAGATSFTLASSGGTIALKVGDIIKIGTESNDLPNTYSVTEAVTITTGTSDTCKINRGLQTAKTTGTSVTMGASTWATAINNIGGDPTGIGIVMRYPSDALMGARVMGDSVPLIDPVTGAVLCLTHLAGYHMSQWEVSALFGTAFVDDRKLCRLLSYTALTA